MLIVLLRHFCGDDGYKPFGDSYFKLDQNNSYTINDFNKYANNQLKEMRIEETKKNNILLNWWFWIFTLFFTALGFLFQHYEKILHFFKR